MANFVVSSRSRFARNSILMENIAFQSLPLLLAAACYMPFLKKKSAKKKIHIPKIGIFDF